MCEAESLAADVNSAEKSAHSVQAKGLPNKLANNLSNLSPVQLERNRMKAIEVNHCSSETTCRPPPFIVQCAFFHRIPNPPTAVDE